TCKIRNTAAILAVCYACMMLGRTYDNQNCSVARALEIVGERWSLLIIRDAIFAGVTRFSEFQSRLGAASNIIANRLEGLINAGLRERRRKSATADHYDYVLTAKGTALQPIILALAAWGDTWAAPSGPPVLFEHTACGTRVEQQIRCP